MNEEMKQKLAEIDRLATLTDDEIFDHLKAKGGTWKVYTNPMRTDSVFLVHEGELTSYEGVTTLTGAPIYHTTPLGSYAFPHGLSHEMAADLVERLNSEDLREG